MFIGACSSSGRGASSSPTLAPNRIVARPVGGSSRPGAGPVVVPDRTTSGAHAQEVVLRDRTLTITGVTRSPRTGDHVVAIRVNIVVRNSGAASIRNERSFFALTGPEGDVFSSLGPVDGFDGAVVARGSRHGSLMFAIPEAAASGLRLIYRPEVASESAIVPLRVG